jgi:hypothetical protein
LPCLLLGDSGSVAKEITTGGDVSQQISDDKKLPAHIEQIDRNPGAGNDPTGNERAGFFDDAFQSKAGIRTICGAGGVSGILAPRRFL